VSDQWGGGQGSESALGAVPDLGRQEQGASGWAAGPSAAATAPPEKVPIEEMPTAGSRVGVYLEELASDQPTPGGGAWAAVSAAAGAALESVVDRMRAIADECDDERYTLLALADRDAEAYRDVMAAYKLPKNTPEEQHTWSTTLQRSLERAADIPLEVARRAVYLMALAEETLTSGNPNAASDALSAATSLHAAALSALANVDINAITFIDKTRQQELADSANSLRHRAQSLLRDVSEAFFIAVHT
jgi:formiminotetrahydrofolate cyclodeaminase